MKAEKSVVEKNTKKPRDVKSLHARRRWVVIALVSVLMIILVVTVALLLIKKPDEVATLPLSKEALNTTVMDIQSNSNIDAESANRLADEAIKNTNDNYQKTIILVTKASTYYDNQDYDKALEIAMEAYNIESNDNVCSYIARIYETKGDKQKAIEYYQYAIDSLKSTSPDDGDIGYYEDMIKLLNGQAIEYEE